MRVTASLPTGVAALLPAGARRRRRLEADFVTRLEERGFSEVVLPVVDYVDPYDALLSETSRSELYRFVDRDGEVLALRADFTPMLARLLAPRLPSLELPLRLFYRGDVLRYQEERA
ncbi:MAG: ATP phosphoribosyltransferase regulatory subunit, partial [Acidobacteriota bacterium]